MLIDTFQKETKRKMQNNCNNKYIYFFISKLLDILNLIVALVLVAFKCAEKQQQQQTNYN